MTIAAPKPEFFTPATFKHAAVKFAEMLKQASGFEWRLHGITKSNRNTFEGRELYLAAKLYAADGSKPVASELSVSLMTRPSGLDYEASVMIEHRLRAVLDEHFSGKDFTSLVHWISNFRIPSHVTEEIVKTASLAERVAFRWAHAPRFKPRSS